VGDHATLWTLLRDAAATRTDDLFAVDEHDRELTFAQVAAATAQIASAIHRCGLRPGSVVSWQLPNTIDSLIVMLGLSRAGLIQNPLLPSLQPREINFICAQAKSELLVNSTGSPLVDGPPVVSVEQLMSDPSREPVNSTATGAVAFYYYTSGTTAEPKGVKHTNASVIAAARGLIDALTLNQYDRVPLVFPVAHIGGAIHVARALLTGGPILISSNPKPPAITAFLQHQRATVVPGSPPFVAQYFAQLDQSPDELLFPHARLLNHGGSPKPPHLHNEVRRRLGTAGIISGYGLTECPMAVFNEPGDSDALLATTEGRPVGGAQLRIVLSDETDAAPGVVGEIRLKGPQLMVGYVQASLDAEAFDAQGFIRTGDLGLVEASGHLRVTGRLKDIIIRNMENVSALEVENLIVLHPGVNEVSVIGLPDPRTGERVCAVVVPTDSNHPPTLADLTAFLRTAGLSTFKLPEQLHCVDSLPKGPLNKVVKQQLRDMLA
jgi:acyl-CoA synthetase (AMP-forming)/AMP-acid ligase II